MSVVLRARVAAMLAAAGVSALPVSQAMAEDALEQVVVTANRIAQPISEVIGSVTVITREEIERRQVNSLQDLLRGETGIDIVNQGGLGKLSAMFMRGTNSSQTLFLVNGMRVGSATSGTTAIELIPIDQIERVEIVRGPRSSLYGSDAMGGVIQIFTRQPNGAVASVSYGSYNTQNYSAGFGLNAGDLRFSVNGNYIQSDGFNACQGSFSGGCYAFEPDNDGYRNTSGTAHIGYAFNKATDLDLSVLHATGYTEYDGYNNQNRFKEITPEIKLRITPNKSFAVELQGSSARDDRDNFKNGQFLSRFNTRKDTASLLASWIITREHRVSVGTDYLHDSLDAIPSSNTPDALYTTNSRSSHGEFVQYLGIIGPQEVSASARHDHSSQYGSYGTGNLGWKWFVLNRALAVNAGWGKAFHAPTFDDLYYPFGLGNPNLLPERSINYELGMSGTIQGLDWSMQGFLTTVHNFIALDSNFFPVNTEAKLRGVEMMIGVRLDRLRVAINYTALDPRSRQSGASYDHILPRRARQSGRFDASYDFGPAQVSATLNAVGPRFDNLENTARLGGYTTVDFNTAVELCKALTLQVKLANFFDRRYETARFYNQEGRAIYVTLRYQGMRQH